LGLGAPLAAALLGKGHRRRERWFAGILLGTAIVGLLMFLLGVCGLWRGPVPFVVLAIGAATGVFGLARERARMGSDLRRVLSGHGVAGWLVVLIAAVVGALALLYALTPPVQSDALRYHLAAPAEWIKAGRITYLPGSVASNFPFLVEMNFALALLCGLPAGAKLVHLFYLVLAAGGVALIAGNIARREDGIPKGLRPGLLAATLLLTHPIASLIGSWAFVELASLAYLLGMIWALVRWAENKRTEELVLAALFGGAAFASKYTNLAPLGFAALLAGIIAGWKQPWPKGLREGFLTACAFGLIGCAVCSPWLIRNFINTGNPVYPLAYSIFGGPDWSEENAAFYSEKAADKGSAISILYAKHREAAERGVPGPTTHEMVLAQEERLAPKALRLARLPWNSYRWPSAFESSPQGPLLVLVFPLAIVLGLAGLFRRPPPRRWIPGAFVLFLFVLWAATYQSNRFLLPVPVLLGAFLAAWTIGKGRIGRTVAIALATFALIAQSVWVSGYILAGDPYASLRYAVGLEDRDSYLRSRIEYYAAARTLSEKDEPVLLAGEHRTFYFDCDVAASDWFDTPAVLRLLRDSAGPDGRPNVEAALDRLLDDGVTLVYFNLETLMQPDQRALSDWFQKESSRHSSEPTFNQAWDRLVSSGRTILPGQAFIPLGHAGSNYDFWRKRFANQGEWQSWLDFATSDRLEIVESTAPLQRICRILPGSDGQ